MSENIKANDSHNELKDTPSINQLKSIGAGVNIIATGTTDGLDWVKISYMGTPLDFPIFEKQGTDIAGRIRGFLRTMAIDSCREKLFGMLETCNIEVSYQGSNKGKGLSDGNKRIARPEDFINFVGIPIDMDNALYATIRRELAKDGVYPANRTMLDDFVKFWNSLTVANIKTNEQPITATAKK